MSEKLTGIDLLEFHLNQAFITLSELKKDHKKPRRSKAETDAVKKFEQRFFKK